MQQERAATDDWRDSKFDVAGTIEEYRAGHLSQPQVGEMLGFDALRGK